MGWWDVCSERVTLSYVRAHPWKAIGWWSTFVWVIAVLALFIGAERLHRFLFFVGATLVGALAVAGIKIVDRLKG
ncbi:hypothetical protein EV646_110208 [Kribbella antiqua]|uniref:Uncharacterized protein n=1 Tax=Kribbella antiqua TaxID=2512217 RepID=A0A4R2IHY7_9ACTN|nr:hypothetical protein EV646_110208 [Kribbella antiqua]